MWLGSRALEAAAQWTGAFCPRGRQPSVEQGLRCGRGGPIFRQTDTLGAMGGEMRLRERGGTLAGKVLAPALWAGTQLRKRRVLHPAGVVYRAEVTPLAVSSALRPLAEGLGSHAIVRFSAGWWRTPDRRPDLLGCALRFCEPDRELSPSEGDQDLILATLRLPWTLPLAILSTNPTNWLAHHYYGASPFEVEGLGWVKLRLRPPDESFDDDGENRLERLWAAAERGEARFQLELKRHLVPSHWVPLAEVSLREVRDVGKNALRFNPFLAGRGFRPVGFVHAVRRPVYRASQRAHGRDVELQPRPNLRGGDSASGLHA